MDFWELTNTNGVTVGSKFSLLGIRVRYLLSAFLFAFDALMFVQASLMFEKLAILGSELGTSRMLSENI